MNKIVRNLLMLFLFVGIITILGSCSSLDALKDINENPEQVARGNPLNNATSKTYLEQILADPTNREVKAFNRRAYNPDNKKTLFLVHSFYAFFKEQELEHTLVFTAAPKGSEVKGTWMLDAASDLESYRLFVEGSNPWEVQEYLNKDGNSKLHFEHTVESILKRINDGYTFFGPASVRNLPWYHHLWLVLTPPPVIALSSILLMSIKTDNCNSAVIETMQWE
ncbi:MAG: hypothetical protein ACOXZ2_08590 [Sphaerochaetaceae bacterium]|nr:hypothetical protein [Sphaerochaetaceae bacterium]HHU88028.1 hypothetical protein [Spirochaetales bacterium]